MQNFVKIVLGIGFLLAGSNSFSQEFNTGICLGYNVIHDEQRIKHEESSSTTLGAIFEWRPNHAIFSLNSGARVIMDSETSNVSFPFYFKFSHSCL